MPPKKKSRISRTTSPGDADARNTKSPVSTPAAAPAAIAAADASPANPDEAALNDPWTDEEETGLFKGLMRWKPTGIHRHFRLLSLHAWMLENHHIHPNNQHTKPAGIWAKLNQLYDLPALDAREDARQLSPLRVEGEQEVADSPEERGDEDDVYSVAANKIETEPFELPPDQGFEEMMWRARFAPDDDGESDVELDVVNLAREPPVRFTPSFSIEPSEAARSTSRAPRGRRGRRARAAAGGPRRSARKTESVADKDEQHDKGDEPEPAHSPDENDGNDNNEDNEDDEANEEHDESADEEKSHASTPGPRRGRGSRGGGRGRGTARGRGRGRGRAR